MLITLISQTTASSKHLFDTNLLHHSPKLPKLISLPKPNSTQQTSHPAMRQKDPPAEEPITARAKSRVAGAPVAHISSSERIKNRGSERARASPSSDRKSSIFGATGPSASVFQFRIMSRASLPNWPRDKIVRRARAGRKGAARLAGARPREMRWSYRAFKEPRPGAGAVS